MLNISENSINGKLDLNQLKSLRKLKTNSRSNLFLYIILVLLITGFISMFLPWTQSVKGKGYVTTRSPENRPQSIQAIIAGKLEKWYVQEGDQVKKGDTLAYITEIKSEYFDPNLVQNTATQVDAKNQSIEAYDGKIVALQTQMQAAQQAMQLKIQQAKNKIQEARNKVKIDSIELIAMQNNLEIAANQLTRNQELFDKGLKSLSDLQDKQLKFQQSQAKVNAQINKLSNQRNQLSNAMIDVSAIEREYADKIAKTQSDIQSTQGSKLDAIANTAKLENQLSNYKVREQFYYITAPQDGFVTKTLKSGIGEIIKEGADLATIVPVKQDFAVEFYVKPVDLPLMQIGEKVNLSFDGWPALVISGWPEASTGIFKGEVSAIEQNISSNGLYRVLVTPDKKEREWPYQLRNGAGTTAFVLLNEVPIWYELWRQLNGFPADYYSPEQKADIETKTPIKKIK